MPVSSLGFGQVDGSSAAGHQFTEALPASTSSEPEKALPLSLESGTVPDSLIGSSPLKELPIPEFQEESKSSEDDSVLAAPASAVLVPSRHTGLHHLRSAEKADQLPSYLKGDSDSEERIK
ncbi:uncharacterized protein EI90DRAFT_3133807 [Cantharellus anzutake]|uniref:uncharacterized protein n=1 Tax=Cantharellus anzutake TaxID=1750568 RepID=UPI001906597A|nr:uncharacterized protein EI90DRAFT_3133807 [Cantharellus anzutake]KAF8317540.1 hypothetical protein EI90DRAFT_3133807 [Cantharellus anzutake]